MPIHDPKIMPSGKPCPPGFNWDGVRLVRNKKGSKRPPDTPSEFWHMYSAEQREEDIARYKRKVELEEERIRKESEEAAPAMPVMHGNVPEPIERRCFGFTGRNWVRLLTCSSHWLPGLFLRLRSKESPLQKPPWTKNGRNW